MTMHSLPRAGETAFHTHDGRAFVGLRVCANGRRQVVYDETSGKRVIITLADPACASGTLDRDIFAALNEGAAARNPLGGIVAALKARHFEIEY